MPSRSGARAPAASRPHGCTCQSLPRPRRSAARQAPEPRTPPGSRTPLQSNVRSQDCAAPCLHFDAEGHRRAIRAMSFLCKCPSADNAPQFRASKAPAETRTAGLNPAASWSLVPEACPERSRRVPRSPLLRLGCRERLQPRVQPALVPRNRVLVEHALLHALVESGDGRLELLLRGLGVALRERFAQRAQAGAHAAAVGPVLGGAGLGLTGALERRNVICHSLFP